MLLLGSFQRKENTEAWRNEVIRLMSGRAEIRIQGFQIQIQEIPDPDQAEIPDPGCGRD